MQKKNNGMTTGKNTQKASGASGAASSTKQEQKHDASQAHKSHRARNIVIAVVAVVIVALVGIGIGAYGAGVITPASAAAKYGTFDYLDESEVTDYIMTYKEQMGYGDAEDEDWAEFLAAYNLTPERLRLSTIEQLLSDIAVQKEAAKQGITVSDDEVDVIIESLKDSYGMGDDEIWAETLELYGQTEEGLREVYSLELLKQKLCSQEVEMPTPTDDEVVSYIESYVASCQYEEAMSVETSEEYDSIMNGEGEALVRHSYCFVYDIEGDEATLEESNQVELIKQEFEESGLDVDTFVTLLALYSNDEEAIESNGAMGWDIDTDEYSDTYLQELENTAIGGVSNVFTDGDTICFIWVDQAYSLPYDQDELAALDLDAMPSSLYQYFSDCAAYDLWEDDCDTYLSELLSTLSVTVYEMPSDVPYNVDMSDYLVTEDEEVDSADAETEDEDADGGSDDGGGEEGETASTEDQLAVASS